MSYASRAYRQRNPKSTDESKDKPFFSKKGDPGKEKKEEGEQPVRRLATTSDEEVASSNDQRMRRDKEKPCQRKTDQPEKVKKPLPSDPQAGETDKKVARKEGASGESEGATEDKTAKIIQ